MEEPIPPHYMTPKMLAFSGLEDLETHLKAFQAHMLNLGGSDAIRYKMLQGTFTRTALKWFSGLLDGTIHSFQEFYQMFGEQFAANIITPPRIADLFDIKQKESEPLKEYLNHFCEVSICL